MRQTEKGCINIALYFDIVKNVSINSITLRDENHEYLEEYYDRDLPLLSDLGGFSGCHVFVCRNDDFNKLELIGFMYEGGNEMFRKKLDTYQ